ncbi:uncharacterized protein LOC9654284 [Selaginella moellendorffii]|uniref:uncharacterized protein LOC9654284 n=1 Tax=Selaginella moellendorffii TaxID=88036 RepID=UPI000D1C90DE|nr:uncharacterized protein LOC9654284 [Selaginella moellendorffii]|eukprot:XP_024524475.1 uncharacterized protein LOC9654284 [Selaginella moellendorffii]
MDRFGEGKLPQGLRGDSRSESLWSGVGVERGVSGLGNGFKLLRVPQAFLALLRGDYELNGLFPTTWFVPTGIQTHKCDKCVREFFSPFNCRRHMRFHRKTLHPDKDELSKQRDAIGQFWAQLSPAQASEILSLKSSRVDEITGTNIEQALQKHMQMSGVAYLTQAYFRAGRQLEDIRVNAAANVPSEVLFKVLDDASEKTFLIGGTSVAVARYVYQKDPPHGEEKNAIATLAFLIEDNLVKAWNAEKDKKALDIQRALVEEEEAAQKKRERELERKRLKKQRQREKRAGGNPPDTGIQNDDTDLQQDVESAAVGGFSSLATGAEDSDVEKVETGTARWAEEPDNSQEEFTVSRPQRRRFVVHTQAEQKQSSFPKYKPRYTRGNRGANVGANGYTCWTRKNNADNVCDASTAIEADSNPDGILNDHAQGETIPGEKLTGAGEAEQVPNAEGLDDSRVVHQDQLYLDQEELMIGTLSIPLNARALEALRPSSQRFDSLEKELLTPVSSKGDGGTKAAEDEMPAAEECSLENQTPASAECEATATGDEQEFARVAEACMAFLVDRWRKAISDPEAVVFAVLEESLADGETPEVQKLEAGPEGGVDGHPEVDKAGNGEADKEEAPDASEVAGSVGNSLESGGVASVGNLEAGNAEESSSGGNVLGLRGGVKGEEEKRLDGRNGTCNKKAGSNKWKKGKASEQRYLPKKQ